MQNIEIQKGPRFSYFMEIPDQDYPGVYIQNHLFCKTFELLHPTDPFMVELNLKSMHLKNGHMILLNLLII